MESFQQEVMRSLGRIEGTLDSIVLKQSQQAVEHGKLVIRVGALEQFRAKAVMLASLVGAVVGGFATFVGNLILNKV